MLLTLFHSIYYKGCTKRSYCVKNTLMERGNKQHGNGEIKKKKHISTIHNVTFLSFETLFSFWIMFDLKIKKNLGTNEIHTKIMQIMITNCSRENDWTFYTFSLSLSWLCRRKASINASKGLRRRLSFPMIIIDWEKFYYRCRKRGLTRDAISVSKCLQCFFVGKKISSFACHSRVSHPSEFDVIIIFIQHDDDKGATKNLHQKLLYWIYFVV